MKTRKTVEFSKTSRLVTAVVAVATSVTLPMPASADTVTTNGVTWTYVTNADGVNTVTLGPGGSGITTSNCADSNRAIPAATSVSASLIPWVFENNGVTYTVTRVNKYAFYRCQGMIGTLTIPDTVKVVGERAFSDIGTSVTRVASLGGVTSVGNHAFNNISPLGDVPDFYNITSYGTSAFEAWTKVNGNANVVFNPALTAIPAYLFRYSHITAVKIPRSVTKVSYGAFNGTYLSGLLIPGPATAASDTQYTEVDPSGLLQNASYAKVFFAGRHTKASSIRGNPMFDNTADLKAFVPANGLWDGELNLGGTRTQLIKYGPGEEIDFALDTEEKVITAMPTTEAAFTNALNWATLFKDKLGYDTRISVTNSIEVSGEAVTAEMLANVQLNSTLMMFAVKTQAQLDSVLAAVPQTAMLAIDPTGAREELTMPKDRALWVWLSGTGKYTPYFTGFKLIFR